MQERERCKSKSDARARAMQELWKGPGTGCMRARLRPSGRSSAAHLHAARPHLLAGGLGVAQLDHAGGHTPARRDRDARRRSRRSLAPRQRMQQTWRSGPGLKEGSRKAAGNRQLRMASRALQQRPCSLRRVAPLEKFRQCYQPSAQQVGSAADGSPQQQAALWPRLTSRWPGRGR